MKALSARAITGTRYGKLVAMRRVEFRADIGQVWAFLCDCGAEAIRALGQVRYFASRHKQSCRACAKSFWKARCHEGKQGRRFDQQWRRTGTIWDDAQIDQLQRRIMSDLEDEYGLAEEHVPANFARGLYRLDDDEGTKGWMG